MCKDTRIVTGKNIRLLYPALMKPVSINGSRAKYSTTILISKTDDFTINGVKKAIQAAYEAGTDVLRGSSQSCPPLAAINTPFHDGDIEKQGKAEYSNCFYLTATSYSAPGIVDSKLNDITDDDYDVIYSGAYARVSITFQAYNFEGKKGISCHLNNVQIMGGGTRIKTSFVPKLSAADEFAAFDADEDNP